MNKALTLLWTILLIFIMTGCRKDTCNDPSDIDCSNYDPCFEKKGINADFTIKEQLIYTVTLANGSQVDQYYLPETDTVYTANTVELEAKALQYDSLKWFIGAEVLSDRKVRRKYFPSERHTQIMLIVYFRSFVGCNPGNDGVDTVVKSLYSVGQFENIPISGVYEGTNTDDPGNPFTIQLNDTTVNYSGSILGRFGRTGCIQQFPRGNTDEDWNKFDQTVWGGMHFFIGHVKELDTGITRNNFGLYGSGELKNGIVTIRYTYDDNGYQHYLTGKTAAGIRYVSKTFIGRKVRDY